MLCRPGHPVRRSFLKFHAQMANCLPSSRGWVHIHRWSSMQRVPTRFLRLTIYRWRSPGTAVVGRSVSGWVRSKGIGDSHHSPGSPGSPGSPVITVSTFASEPEAPWLSVTVTRIVKLPSRYECDALIVPWLDVLPLVDEPSPQLMVYDHGPSLLGSLHDAVSLQRIPTNTVW